MFLGGKDAVSLVSEEGVQQVLEQMVRMGYFHRIEGKNLTEDDDDDNHDDDDLEAYRQWQSIHVVTDNSDDNQKFSWDYQCELIPTTTAATLTHATFGCNKPLCYYTQNGLVKELVRCLDSSLYNGRASIRDLCRDVDVNCNAVFLSVTSERMTTRTGNPSSLSSSCSIWDLLPESITILKQGGGIELLSANYWETMAKDVVTSRVNTRDGRVALLDLSSELNLPLELLVKHVVTNLPSAIRFLEDSKVIVSDVFLQKLKRSGYILSWLGRTDPDQCRMSTAWMEA
jgi:hypothetical protein